MKELRMKMVGKPDRNENDYYYTTTSVPVLIDLSQAVIHVYPFEDGEGFGAELVVRKYDPSHKEETNYNGVKRRRQRSTKTEESTEEK